MMQHEECAEALAALALGALDPVEERQVARHAEACPVCGPELAAYREVAAHLATLEAAPPLPAGFGAELLQSVRADGGPPLRQGRSPTRWVRTGYQLGLAAALVAAVGLGAWNVRLQGDVLREQRQLAASQQLLNDVAGASPVYLLSGSGEAAQARGTLVQVADSRKLVVLLRDTPPPPAGKVYQLWLVKGDTPISAGVFRTDAQGNLHLEVPMAADQVPVVAVTEEAGPNGSDAGPRGPRVMLGNQLRQQS